MADFLDAQVSAVLEKLGASSVDQALKLLEGAL